MLARFFFIVLLGMLLSSCVIRPAEHTHYRPVAVPSRVVVAPPVRINTTIIRYRDACDKSLLRNAYIPACDQYIQLTAGDIYLSDHRIRQTRERFLRHRHRHQQNAGYARNRNILAAYRQQCDRAIERHDYVPACDRYIQLATERSYRGNRNIRAIRAEYLAYKKDYKKSRRNIRMYGNRQPHENRREPEAEHANAFEKRLDGYRNQCDGGLRKKRYVSACDRYLDLTAYKVYLRNKDIRKTRERYLKFKKRYKKYNKKMPLRHE